MCGRYSLNLKDNHSSFKKETINNFKSIFDYKNEDICPTNKAPIVFNLNSNFVFKQSSWGLSFDWLPKGKTLFNIRSETVHEKSFSNSLIANNRCLVPFSSYFEWLKTQELKNKYKVEVLNFNSEIMKKMFEISSSVIMEFSNLGEIHKEIYKSCQNSLIKYNKYQKFSDYGYIKERINSLKV